MWMYRVSLYSIRKSILVCMNVWLIDMWQNRIKIEHLYKTTAIVHILTISHTKEDEACKPRSLAVSAWYEWVGDWLWMIECEVKEAQDRIRNMTWCIHEWKRSRVCDFVCCLPRTIEHRRYDDSLMIVMIYTLQNKQLIEWRNRSLIHSFFQRHRLADPTTSDQVFTTVYFFVWNMAI